MILGILATILIVVVLFAAQGIYRNWDVYRGRAKAYDALPVHLDEVGEIEDAFPDDSQYTGFFGRIYRKFHKVSKPWGVFGPRSKFNWARWRPTPKVLFAVGGKGPWRWESVIPTVSDRYTDGVTQPAFCYLSRIQYYKRWHFAIQWPFIVTFHIYPKAYDVPLRSEDDIDTDGTLWFFYWNHFDADLVYWMVASIYLGRNWK